MDRKDILNRLQVDMEYAERTGEMLVHVSRKTVRAVMDLLTPAEIEMEGGGSYWYSVCGECHGAIDENDLFCKHCGRPVKQT